jgi:hypothetical protein
VSFTLKSSFGSIKMGCRGEARRSVDTVHLLPSSAVAGKQPEVFSNGMQDLCVNT